VCVCNLKRQDPYSAEVTDVINVEVGDTAGNVIGYTILT